jgi:hypothetical protein
MYHWSVRTPIRTIEKELTISRATVITWFQMFRNLAVKDLDKENLVVGGNRMVVEIDESLFVKVKHHKGKDLKRPLVWVFGIYESETKRVLFFVVPSRDAFTLLNIIYKHCAPKSII